MAERRHCQWMKNNKYKDEPCNICKGYVVVKGRGKCPFYTETYALFQHMQHLVTADERFFSIQAGVRADKRR